MRTVNLPFLFSNQMNREWFKNKIKKILFTPVCLFIDSLISITVILINVEVY